LTPSLFRKIKAVYNEGVARSYFNRRGGIIMMNAINEKGKKVTCDVCEAIDIIGEFDWRDAMYFEKLVQSNMDQGDLFREAERRFNKKETELSIKRSQLLGQIGKMIDQYISDYMREYDLGEYITEQEFIDRYGEDYYFGWES
jgi:hypothetical protein